jgi:hypothetical protein
VRNSRQNLGVLADQGGATDDWPLPVGLREWELIYCVSRCSELYVDKSHLLPAVPDSAQELQLKVFTEAR